MVRLFIITAIIGFILGAFLFESEEELFAECQKRHSFDTCFNALNN